MKAQEILTQRLDSLCKEKGMSYYLLAARAGMPITTLMNIANGNTKNPGVFTMIKISDGLGMTIQEFFDTEEFRELGKELE